MISRRDKLLVRPWEQRRYENHRRKVQSALPAIDVGPPANRIHVFYKLKKQQTESERCDKIEKDNLKLLQRMRTVMSTSRVDNFWDTEQPKFLNRVTLYNTTNNKIITKNKEQLLTDGEKTRRGRCYACTPKKLPPPKIPEERVPWEPVKAQVSRKRSNSLPTKKVQIAETTKIETNETESEQKIKDIKPVKKRVNKINYTGKMNNDTSLQSIILKRDGLHLAVNFPSDTLVKLKNGHTEKFIISGPCHCKAIRS